MSPNTHRLAPASCAAALLLLLAALLEGPAPVQCSRRWLLNTGGPATESCAGQDEVGSRQPCTARLSRTAMHPQLEGQPMQQACSWQTALATHQH